MKTFFYSIFDLIRRRQRRQPTKPPASRGVQFAAIAAPALVITALVVATIKSQTALTGCSDAIAHFSNGATFALEVADTRAARSKGLQGRSAMAATEGMLFVYEKTAERRFWMKDTELTLDLFFLSDEGRVLLISKDALPYDTSPIVGPQDTLNIIELNGGTADLFGLSEGQGVEIHFHGC